MARNIEIKAHARDFEAQTRLAENLGNGVIERIIQEDTFFNVPTGRLKLRAFEDGSGELIQYERESFPGPRECRYVRTLVNDPASLKEVLANALGVRAVIRKERTVFFCGQTRIHLDQVEGLGRFIELEIVLEPDQDLGYGAGIAQDLMSRLKIEMHDLIAEAYVDLLACEGP